MKIVLVAHAYLIRSGMEQLFNEIQGLVLIDVFEGSEKSLSSKIKKLNPDILIVDTNSLTADFNSFINDVNKNTGCLTIGLFDSKTPENIKSHFTGCLNKTEGKYEILEQFKHILGDKLTKKPSTSSDSILSEREKTIVKQVVNGHTNQEVADKLFLSIHTVTTHRKNISNKLGIKTVSGLTVYALMNKIVDLHEIEHR